ncbi:MAG TPA: D-alanyl-D-alanine carboxypeptidase/D-alanyl-D-alanine-endopeptidase [Burkholderiaceae bacterium]|nr:D-alanyl-D-alanine carboxypeptidase/D-alanyl-D-alanine-endopeptidase [Burkholderiaceae bacterium]
MIRLLVALLLWVGAAHPALAQRMPAPLVQALQAAGVTDEQFGLVVMPVSGGAALAEHNARQPLNPASAMKLVTTYAALGLLGADYRWRTRVWARGIVEDGVLAGHLVIEGGGDPKFVIEDLTELIARLRARGLREIRGDLIVDDALYDVGDDSVEAFDDGRSQPYNVRPHAALMNFKSTRVVARSDGKTVDIELDPPLADVRVLNAVRATRGACRAGAAVLAVSDAGSPARPAIRVAGALPSGCAEASTYASVLTHPQFIHSFFKAAWQRAGGSWDGATRIERGGAGGELLDEWISPRPLSEIVRDVNKFSNNVMARQLMLQLAAERGARPATPAGARAIVQGWLRAQGLRFPELVVDNGSGLSRDERIAPASLATLLAHAASSPHRQAFVDSLPTAGVDGTMRYRLVSDPVAGNAWIKTGSLADVRSIAGYVQAASGRVYAIVLLVNSPRANATAPAQDALLRWVYANG